ncbi:RibD family protein [Corallococcus silvisoli]|uniref:RibD family protein n=1 Tax=Corallococcus silvisoli TaxID=2697031 RepID=UPI0013783085|nr:dihydrofolate reductase family protein [Corallococcus silvisoli]NBD12565.1 deaminase [Corallococcus silvisoli]
MKPLVICHMLSSIDGRIVVTHWPDRDSMHREYERTADSFGADAWMCGRITMQDFAATEDVPKPPPASPLPRTDFIAREDAESFAIAVDAHGKLNWESGALDEDHLVIVLTEAVPDAHLAHLRERGVSYVFGGARDIDFARVLETLGRAFGIRTVLLEGGGGINGTLLDAGLIDEVSLLVHPTADGLPGTPTLFDRPQGATGMGAALELTHVERRDSGIVWLRYRVRPAAR